MGDSEKIKKVLCEIEFQHLIDYFIEEEFSFKAFRSLSIESVKEFLPKAGQRALFWSEYTKYFKEYDSQVVEEDKREENSLLEEDEVLLSTAKSLKRSFAESNQESTEQPEGSSSFQKDEDLELFIRRYLSSSQGRIIRRKYENGKALTNKDRATIAKIVIHAEHDLSGDESGEKKFKISADILTYFSKKICEVFPKELPSVYFTPYNTHTKALSTGKLWTQYNVFKRELRDSQLKTSDNHNHVSADFNKNSLSFLQLNTQPWDKVVQSWKETYPRRRELLDQEGYEIHDYFKEFPALKTPKGFELLLVDFELEFEKSVNLFFSKWSDINSQLIILAKKKLHQSDLDEVDLNHPHQLRGFIYLTKLLKVAYLSKKKNQKKIRLSQEEIRKRLILHVKEANLLEEQIKQDNEKLDREQTKRQPRLILAGEDFHRLTGCYVEVNSTQYLLDSSITAIDTYFKVLFALRAQYPEGTQLIWTFIQNYVYEIHTKYDSSYLAVNSLICDLRSLDAVE